jgi:hypothetical protein
MGMGTFGRLAVGAALTLAACAPQAPSCAPPAVAATGFEVYFGRDKPGGEVTDTEWQAFLNEILSPRFPDGLTVLDAEGRWRDPRTGRGLGERTKLVLIVAPDGAAARQAVDAVAADYRRRFDQHTVLRVERPVCAIF